MKTIPVNSWEEFLEAVSNDPKDTVYRGQANFEWSLGTTLERAGRKKETFFQYHRAVLTAKPAIESYTDRRWDVLREFDPEEIEPKRLWKGGATLPGYEFMLHLRHCGFPSPYLDWTASAYVALFFAFNQTDSTHCAIYAFREYGEEAGGKSGGNETRTGPIICALGPTIRTHERHYRQQAQYTICVKKTSENPTVVPGDNIAFWSHEEGGCLYSKKYVIPTDGKKEVMQKLRQMNVTAYTLFGTEDSLVESLAAEEYR